MFWFLHYAVKVLIALGLMGIVLMLYLNRHWFNPADDWVEQMRRIQTETVPILGVVTGRVVRVTSGERLIVDPANEPAQSFQIVGITVPSSSPNPRSPQSEAFRWSRDFLRDLALSNEVRVAYTLLVPQAGGLGGVYLGNTNLAVPLLSAGCAIVHDASLRSLPVTEQMQLLAAEKEARDGRRGLWTNAALLADLQKKP